MMRDLPHLPARTRSLLEGATLHEPVGCPACHGTGYRGRTAIHEVLRVGARVRDSLTRPEGLGDAARADGMQPMLTDGLQKVASGLTSLQEVLRVVPPDSCG